MGVEADRPEEEEEAPRRVRKGVRMSCPGFQCGHGLEEVMGKHNVTQGMIDL